jgi:hypothetical protein
MMSGALLMATKYLRMNFDWLKNGLRESKMKQHTKNVMQKWAYRFGGLIGACFAIKSVLREPESIEAVFIGLLLFIAGAVCAGLMFNWADDIR